MIRVEVVDAALTRELRRAVLRPTHTSDDVLPGDELADAVHVAASDGGLVVGTCFVYPESCPWRPDDAGAWHLRQMATAPDRQGQGIGALVLAAAHDAARDRGGRLLWCLARDTAAGFYEAHGWQEVGDMFVDAETSLPHRRMSVELPPVPTSSA